MKNKVKIIICFFAIGLLIALFSSDFNYIPKFLLVGTLLALAFSKKNEK